MSRRGRTTAGLATDAAALERHLDGSVFGDSREASSAAEFLHPILRLACVFQTARQSPTPTSVSWPPGEDRSS
jgi:hypothetical protein